MNCDSQLFKKNKYKAVVIVVQNDQILAHAIM